MRLLYAQIILSQKGVDKNPRTLQGNTPLHLAALNNREPAIKLLVKSVHRENFCPFFTEYADSVFTVMVLSWTVKTTWVSHLRLVARSNHYPNLFGQLPDAMKL
jgi:ankyrin repeat protein